MKRPTQQDIADIAKVSNVTVSLALRGHPSIPKTTRERIQDIAKQIGYRPDPALLALMAYRREIRLPSYQGTLAWINNYEQPDKLRHEFSQYLLGAQERCVELGYQLEEFRLTELNKNFSRLSKVFRARNIQGLLFPPQDQHHRHITKANFDWENYSMITFGFSLMSPQLHVVTNAQFRSARLAVRKLRSLGYRRIGLVTESHFNERTDQNFLGGFLVEQLRLLVTDRIPVHLIPKNKSEAEQERAFRKWFFRHAPDAVLIASGKAAEWVNAISSCKRNQCGIALTDISDDYNSEFSGIDQSNKLIGRTAVSMLISMIHANERGIPTSPWRILIEGQWRDGTTAPRITGKRS